MNDLRDLKALMRSPMPILAMRTMEEPRAMRMLETLARDMGLPLYRWSAASGLTHPEFAYTSTPGHNTTARRDLELADDWRQQEELHHRSGRSIADTQPLPATLRHIRARGQKGLYVLLDVQPYLEDPVILRLLREIALDHAVDGRTLVLIGPELDLPPKLFRHAAQFTLSLPDEERIRNILHEEIALFERDGSRVRRTPETEDALVRYAAGLCEEDVRQVMRQSVRSDGALTQADLMRAAQYKQQSTPGLTLEAAPENAGAIGGLLRLRRWLKQRKPIFLGKVTRPGLPPPKAS